MARLSFLDKIGVLIKITSSSKIFIVVILSLLFLAYIFITTNKKNFKTSKIIYLSIYAIIMVSLLFTYRSSLANMFDYLMNNLFIVIYFPNLAIYLTAIVFSNIILWISLFSEKSTKIIKAINAIIYCVMSYILILILDIININRLDVFNQASIYGNTDALALIELSSVIFVGWVCFLIVYKLIRVFQKSHEVKQVEEIAPKEINKQVVKTTRVVEEPYFINAQDNKIKLEQNKKAYSDLLTIDDYKLLLNILSEHKQKEYIENQKAIQINEARIQKENEIAEEIKRVKKLEEVKKQQLEQLAQIREINSIKNNEAMKVSHIEIKPEPIELLDINQNKSDTEKSKFQQLQEMYRSVR